MSSMFRLGKFVQGIERISKKFNGQITRYEVFDPSTERNVVKLKMTSKRLEIESLIDPETKLPTSINVVKGEKPESYEILKQADRISYDDSFPAGLFDFEMPVGVKIVNESIENPVQQLPKSVIQYCVKFNLETIEEAKSKSIFFVNTQVHLVDNEFNWHTGGIKQVSNNSKDVLTGEVGFLNSDGPDLAVFDENGKVRFVFKRRSDHFLSEEGAEELLVKIRPHLSPDIKLGICTREEFLAEQDGIRKQLMSYIHNGLYRLGMDTEQKQRNAPPLADAILLRIRNVYSRSIAGLENERSHGDIKLSGDLANAASISLNFLNICFPDSICCTSNS